MTHFFVDIQFCILYDEYINGPRIYMEVFMSTRIADPLRKIFFIFIFITLIISALNACTPNNKYSGTPVTVLVVFIQFVDFTDDCPDPAECAGFFGPTNQALMNEPRHSASEYVSILDKGVNGYYQKATFGQVYFDFQLLASSRPNGWWASAHTLAEYNHENPSVKQEAVNIAYTELGDKVFDYERILVIYGIQGRAGQTFAVNKPTPFYAFPVNFKKDNLNVPDSQESGYIPMIVSDAAEDVSDAELITLVSHELAHQIGAVDQYYDSYTGMGTWDLMDADWDFHHFGAWTKLDRRWLSWDKNTTKMPCDSGTCAITTVLDPVETMGNNALLIPIFHPSISDLFEPDNLPDPASGQNTGASSFIGIMAECRMPINGDETIPEQGVLVTFSNPYIDFALAGTVSEVLTNEPNPYALLQPGETYYNSKYHITIINISQPGDTRCTVKAERNMIPLPDVYISQSSTPGDGGYDAYRSIDIWNDINANGTEVYPPYEKIYKASTIYGSVDVPENLGDPISLTNYNFVHYMIHNGGDAPAKNVRINVYIRQEINLSVKGSNCGTEDEGLSIHSFSLPILIGTYNLPELKPGQSFSFNEHFKTTSSAPVEIEVEIEPVAGEINTFNNIAYETNNHVYGKETIILADQPGYNGMGVTLDPACLNDIPFIAQEIPGPDGETCEGWDLSIVPASGVLKPGQNIQFNVTGIPAEGAKPGDSCRVKMCVIASLSGDTTSPIACTDFDARVVDPSSLSCSIANQSIALGEAVRVTGALDPKISDTIGLTYTPPTGDIISLNTQTNANGEYADNFTPTLPGIWTMTASWVGDETHGPTDSPVCRFVVGEPAVIPIFTAQKPANCREGTNSFWSSLGITAPGQTYPILGINDDGSWLYIELNKQTHCWVKSDTGGTDDDLSGVPMLPVPDITITPTLIPSITPTKPPKIDCSKLLDQRACEKYDACQWVPDPSGLHHCTKK